MYNRMAETYPQWVLRWLAIAGWVYAGQSLAAGNPGRLRPLQTPPDLSCSPLCTCEPSTRTVQCANQKLTRLPSGIPWDVQHLDFHGNNLKTVGNDTFAQFPQLLSLDLSYNGVEEITPTAFSNNHALRDISLSGNQLTPVQLSFLQNLAVPPRRLALADNAQLNALHMMGNLSLVQELDLRWLRISSLPADFLATMSRIKVLRLDGNHIHDITALSGPTLQSDSIDNTTTMADYGYTNTTTMADYGYTRCSSLEELHISHNDLQEMDCQALSALFPNLQTLDVSYNNLTTFSNSCFHSLPSLTALSLSANPVTSLPSGLFSGLFNLTELRMSHMPSLLFIQRALLKDQTRLDVLDLSYSRLLQHVHPEALSHLTALTSLDLSHTGLASLHPLVFNNLTSLSSLALSGAPWKCDCELQWMSQWLEDFKTLLVIPGQPACSGPPEMAGRFIAGAPTANFTCSQPMITNHTAWAEYKIGSRAVLDCVVDGNPRPAVTWITPLNLVFHHQPAFVDYSLLDPSYAPYHVGHEWHESKTYYPPEEHGNERLRVLSNGSLYIDYVTREDSGHYSCIVINHLGNDTAVLRLRLDYTVISEVTVISIVVGFISAATFFIVTVVIAVIRYVAHFCSAKERRKRKSIREILDAIQEYKSSKFDKLSAYKSAKMDQLSAFKSAKVEKFVAFKTAKIDRLRTYKQVTVTSIIQHLERMRIHYHCQMNRVKDNCTQQVDKLRDNYQMKLVTFQDYKSTHIEKLRENYNGQLLKIREYGSQQMVKLRDQYKLQQQHIIKLMELLDIGNCMTVIEAECMRTESMLFDPNISFDIEAQPAHAKRRRLRDRDRDRDRDGDGDDSPAESEYLTTHSQPPSLTDVCVYNMQNEELQDCMLKTNTNIDCPPRRHRKRRKHREHRAAPRDDSPDKDDEIESPRQRPHHHRRHHKHCSRSKGASKKQQELKSASAAAAAAADMQGDREGPSPDEDNQPSTSRNCKLKKCYEPLSHTLQDPSQASASVSASVGREPTLSSISPEYESALTNHVASPQGDSEHVSDAYESLAQSGSGSPVLSEATLTLSCSPELQLISTPDPYAQEHSDEKINIILIDGTDNDIISSSVNDSVV